MNLCAKTRYLRSNFISNLYRFSSTTPEAIDQNDQVLIDDTDDSQAREAEIEKKRNKSRLSEAHLNLINGRRPYTEPMSTAHLTVKYSRKMYGKYGIESGVNPSLCWPTREEIQDKIEYESVAYPFTIPEMVHTAAEKRREAQLAVEKRDKEIEEKFAKLDQWKKDLSNKIIKKEQEAKKAKEKKERLVEEVRRHFGFTLDPRDERFQEMLAKREKEQKKLEKKARIEARDKVVLAKLQQKNAATTDKKS